MVRPIPRVVSLLEERRADGSTLYMSARGGGSEPLRIEGQDLGPVTEPISPDGEYEYFYTIDVQHIPALVLALGGTPDEDVLTLLRRRWSGVESYRLGQAIRESGIPHEFFAYP